MTFSDLGLMVIDYPAAALFLVGRAYQKYRKRNGATKNRVLPDFFIGAHAA